jgi:hypothetical protein
VTKEVSDLQQALTLFCIVYTEQNAIPQTDDRNKEHVQITGKDVRNKEHVQMTGAKNTNRQQNQANAIA